MKKITIGLLTSLSIYCGHAQTITATGNLTTARAGQRSQLLSNGNVLAIGGDNYNVSNLVAYKTCELYNTSSGTWSSAAAMNQIRTYFSSVLLDNGKILVMGGTTGNWYQGGATAKKSCELYDPTSQTWSYIDSMQISRMGNSFAVKLSDGKVLVAGGSSSLICEIYDPSTGLWTTTTGSLNEVRSEHSLVLLSNGKVLSTGGWSVTAEIFDATAGTWTAVSNNMTASHSNHQSILLDNNKVLISSGGSATCELFDPSNSTFTATGSTILEKNNCPQIKLADGNILTYGIGSIFTPTNTQCIEIYNSNSGTWSNTTYNTGTNLGANNYTIHKLNNGKVLIIGGAATTGNGSSNKCYLLTTPTSGINTISSAIRFATYPNPANERITVKLPFTTLGGTLLLYNTNGQELKRQQIKEDTTELNISDLANGTYFLNIQTEKGIGVERLLIQK